MQKNKFFVLFSVLFGIFLASCDVGLGGAVDTTPPSVTISYPEPASIIRDSFTLAGTCSDDRKVSSVEITLLRTDNGSSEKIGTFYGDVDNKHNSWTVSLNSADGSYNGWELPDGRYVAEAVAKDKSGRKSGTASLSFDIDNTPPLFIMSSPGSSDIENPSSYGSIFKITGTIADDHAVSKMTLKIFSADADLSDLENLPEPVAEWTKNNVETAGGTEVVFANGSENASAELQNDYAALYSDSDSGDKKYKCLIQLEDEAKIYNDPSATDNDSEGNTTRNFFLHDDVYNAWLSSSSGLDAATVKKIINGTSSVSASVQENVLSVYNTNKETVAAFSVNPDANPKYSALGFSVSDWSDFDNTATGGQNVTINVTAGRNGNLIKPATIKVYQFGPYDEDQITDELKSKIYGTSSETFASFYEAQVSSGKAKLLGNNSSSSDSTSESYNYTVTLGTSLNPGSVYFISVYAEDEENAVADPSSDYAFKGFASGTPPTITWPKVSNTSYVNTADDGGIIGAGTLKFSGEIGNGDGLDKIKSFKYTVAVSDELGVAADSTIEGDITFNKTSGEWSFTIPGITAVNKEYLYDITIRAENTSGYTAEKERKVHIDTNPPVVNITGVTPLVESEDKSSVVRQCVNGTITLNGSISESNLEDVYYEVYSNGKKVGSNVDLGAVYSVNRTIDTTSGTIDESDYEIRVTAKDKAGNITTYPSTKFNNDKSLYLKQSTDLPVITGNNFVQVLTAANLAPENDADNGKGNVFDTTSNNKLMGTVTDDDGLASVTITYFNTDNTALTASSYGLSANPLVKDTNGTTSYSINSAVPNKAGSYKVQIKAADNTALSKTTTLGYFFIGVDSENPKITETLVGTDSTQYIKESISFKGTVSDDWEVASAKVNITTDGKTTETPLTVTNGAWSYTFTKTDTTADGDYILEFVVTDKAGKTASATRNLCVDTEAPDFSVALDSSKMSGTSDGSKTWYKTNQVSLKVSGTSTDVSTVEISPDNSSWSSFTKSGDTWTGTATAISEGSNTIYTKVTDKAGNSTVKGTTVYIDTTAPDVCTSTISGTKLISSGKAFTFNVSPSDYNPDSVSNKIDYSKINTVSLTKIGSTQISDATVTDNGNGTFTISVPGTDVKNSGGVVVSVSDKAGNSQPFTLFQLEVDTCYPKTAISQINDADSDTTGIQINKTTVISGTASDDQTLSSVELQYWSSSTGKWVKYNSENSGSVYNWSFAVNTADFTDGSTVKFRAIATDTAGNIGNSGTTTATTATEATAQATVIISQDSDRPVIHLNNLTLSNPKNSRYWHKDSTIYGTVNDDDGTIKNIYWSSDGSAWSDNIYTNGMWTITGLTDGEKDIYFKVEDTNGTIFTSNAASTTAATFGPKIIDAENTKVLGYSSTANDIMLLTVDITSPSIPTPSVYASSDSALAASPDWHRFNDVEAVGGTNRYMFVKVSSSDTNGISDTEVSFNNLTATSSLETAKIMSTETNSTDETVIVRFDLSQIASADSGTKKLKITATDNATKTTTENFDMIVDNTAPAVKYTTKADSTLYGSVANIVQGNTSDSFEVTDLYYTVSLSSTAPSSSAYSKVAYSVADENEISILNWNINFDNETTTTEEFHAPSFYKLYQTLANKTDAQMESDDSTKDMYLWTYAVDQFGNSSTPQALHLNVIPNGDKPAVEITYPTGESVGGTIRVTGTTSIATDSVKAVYIQIDPTYSNSFSTSWKSELQALIDSKSIPSSSYSIVSTGLASPYDYGIKVNGTVSWSQNINSYQEFNGSGSSQGSISIRAFAVSTTNSKISDLAVTTVKVDSDSPLIGNTVPLQLVQYASGNSGTVTARQDYKEDMFIRGQWYLTGSIEDDSGISLATVTLPDGTHTIVNGTTSDSTYVSKNTAISSNTSYSNYNLNIPVGNVTQNDFGSLSYQIEITDGSENKKNGSATIKLNYDNKAPDFSITSSSNGGYGTSSFSNIYQSNGTYTLNGIFNEIGKTLGTTSYNQSGFSRIVMYYTRTLNSSTYLIDPMVSGGTDGISNRESVSGLTKSDSDGLYWRTATGTVNNNILAVTKIGSTAVTELPDTIRAGGLVKINNVIYRISYISGTNVAIDGTLQNITSAATVYFAAGALVIDNTASETGTTAVYDPTKSYTTGKDYMVNGDGDQMVEGAVKSGTTYNWTASIDSSNIMDGSVKVYFVAFDAAGNITQTSFDGTVKNNAPRLAGVYYGADADGNGTVDDDELVKDSKIQYVNVAQSNSTYGATASGKYADGTNVDLITIADADRLTVKGNLKVIPRIVGGNTGLGYTYTYTDNNSKTQTTSVVDYNVGHSSDGSIRNDSEDEGTFDINITTLDFLKLNNNVGIKSGNQQMTFTVWDKTDGTTFGTDSMNASIKIPVNIVLADTEAPTATFGTFYWESSSKNSLYKNSRNNGHIELEDDWKNASGYSSSAAAGTADADPKVSGIISMDGVAEDNSLVSTIAVSVNGTSYTIATRNSSNQFVSTDQMSTAGWDFELVSDDFDNISGKNTVTFRFHWNTEKLISTAAKTDVPVTVTATDRGSAKLNSAKTAITYASAKSSTPGTTQTTAAKNTGYYKMDIVPYITKIYTEMAGLQKRESKWSITSRTSNGNYPVRITSKTIDGTAATSGETIRLYGYNLATSYSGSPTTVAKYTPNGSSSVNLGVGSDTYGNYVSISANTLKATSSEASGAFALTVNNVSSLNNSNDNDSKGSASAELSDENYSTLAYNRQPNGDNNNLLTDDINFDVWEFNSSAAVPISGKIEQPVMKIRPTDGKIGFAFVNGPLYFSMGGSSSTEDYSYQYWVGSYDFFSSIGFTYDESGNSWGVAAGGDINSTTGDKFFLASSKWGLGSHQDEGSRSGNNIIRMERIAQINDSGVIDFDKQAYKSPSLASTVHNGNTNLYLAYYDAMTNEIRFKAGNYANYVAKHTVVDDSKATYVREVLGTDGENNRGGWIKQNNGTDDIGDGKQNGWYFYVCDKNGKVTDTTQYVVHGWYDNGDYIAFTCADDNTQFPGTTNKVSNNTTALGGNNVNTLRSKVYVKLVPSKIIYSVFDNFKDDKVASEPTVEDHTYCSMLAGSDTNREPGQYVSIAAISGSSATNDTICVIWYDETNRCLWYSSNSSPMGRAGDTNASGWSTPVAVFGEDDATGEYCKIAADSYGGIHIAAYDPTNLDLRYAYLPASKKGSASATSDFATCIVDSNGVVGSNLTLDVGKVSSAGNVIPYIGYYATSSIRPKLAYYKGGFAKTATEISDGAVDDEFTGAWECSLVPTNNTIEMQSNQHNDINIGIWKYNGVIIDNATDSTHYKTGTSDWTNTLSTSDTYQSTSYGQVYGNGTKNAVLGYAIKHGATGDNIETAQMK